MHISERPSTVGFMQPHSLAIPTIAIYAAPTDAAGGKAGAEAGFPGASI